MATELNIEERRSAISEVVSKKGFISLAELVQLLEVSESTIRRDLEVLEEQAILRRTHGGAIFTKDTPSHSIAFIDRQTTAVEEKKAIARSVTELIPPDQTVIINGGTTCFEVAKIAAEVGMDQRTVRAHLKIMEVDSCGLFIDPTEKQFCTKDGIALLANMMKLTGTDDEQKS